MSTPITQDDAYIDSRDVIERISEMAIEYGPREGESMDALHTEDMTEEELEEWNNLNAFVEEAEDAEDWEYGATFISEFEFENYAREMASDIHGAAVVDSPWPFGHIDWEEAAESLRYDYTSYTFGNVTFYAR